MGAGGAFLDDLARLFDFLNSVVCHVRAKSLARDRHEAVWRVQQKVAACFRAELFDEFAPSTQLLPVGRPPPIILLIVGDEDYRQRLLDGVVENLVPDHEVAVTPGRRLVLVPVSRGNRVLVACRPLPRRSRPSARR